MMGHLVPITFSIEYGNDCGHCTAGETPKHLTVTFAGLIDCINCIYGGGGATDCFKFLGQAAALNNKGFLLTQTNGCAWQLIDNGNFGTDENWNCDIPGELCTTKWNSAPTTPLSIGIVKTGPATINVAAKLRATDIFFTFTGDVSGVLSNCMEISGISNDRVIACADWMTGGEFMCRGGTMKIREGNWT